VARVTMSAKETADYLGLSYWKLLELVKQKKIPSIRMGNRMIMFRADSLSQWLSQQEVASVQPVETPNQYGKLRKIQG